MTVRVHEGREALQRLEGEWTELWERCPGATPFQHPAWLLPWAMYFGGDELLAVELRRGGELVGLAPFFTHPDPAGRRTLLLLGTGNTDYLDLLVAPEAGDPGAAALLRAAVDAAAPDRVELRQLRPNSSLLRIPPPEGWRGEVMADEVCPVLELAEGAAGLEGVVDASHLSRVRRDRRRLERRGVVEAAIAGEDEFDEAFAALVQLHQLRWQGVGEVGVFGDPAALGFHRTAALALLDAGWLSLGTLRLDGKIIACHYTFTCRGRLYNYVGGFDTEYSHWSPGTLLMAEGIAAAMAEGVRSFDFLRGREAYKYQWGAVDTLTYRLRLGRDGPEGLDDAN